MRERERAHLVSFCQVHLHAVGLDWVGGGEEGGEGELEREGVGGRRQH